LLRRDTLTRRLEELEDQGVALLATSTALILFLVLVATLGEAGRHGPVVSLVPPAAADTEPSGPSGPSRPPEPPRVAPTSPPIEVRRPPMLPGGGRRVFADGRFLVAYYGTAGTGALGVLGRTPPDVMDARLRRAAAPYRRKGERIQPVYELVATVADRGPGPHRHFNHDLSRAQVRRYVAAAHRHGALLVLDLQPGRQGFLTVARRWTWALRDPWVGLALDPEWRMGPRQVPGRTVGRVGAEEVNRTAAWLARLVRKNDLPEKVFVLHQFRVSMLQDPERIRPQPGLAMVQHVDGFGNQRQKMATFHSVARPRQFRLGFKLFYVQDRHLMSPDRVRRIRPEVRFVSYQ
jgi:hypothetical protein